MVLRFLGWRLAASAGLLAAGAAISAPASAQVAFAPEAALPNGGQLVWGGSAPQLDANGQPIYRPSAPRADGLADPVPRAAVPQGSVPQGEGGGQSFEPGPEPASLAPPEPSVDDLYRDLMGGESYREPSFEEPAAEPAPAPVSAAPAPRAPGRSVGEEPIYDAALTPPAADPWAGLQDLSPGVSAVPEHVTRAPPPRARPGRAAPREDTGRTISGYAPMPRGEAQCRKILTQLGVTFTDVAPINKSRSCGVPYPVRVTGVAGDVAVKPAATLNCMAAARLSQWVSQEVKPAARWKLWTRPTALVNASSYRCSRIAGSRTVSEHATGNAVDIAGFKMANGDTIRVEPKGFFDFSEKSFQNMVRLSACEYFGTVLGPGYNRAHDDHFHLDLKERRRTVCK